MSSINLGNKSIVLKVLFNNEEWSLPDTIKPICLDNDPLLSATVSYFLYKNKIKLPDFNIHTAFNETETTLEIYLLNDEQAKGLDQVCQ